MAKVCVQLKAMVTLDTSNSSCGQLGRTTQQIQRVLVHKVTALFLLLSLVYKQTKRLDKQFASMHQGLWTRQHKL